MPFVKVKDIKIRYEAKGQGDPLLFVHGLGSCIEDWQPQIDYFSHFYHTIAFDLRGHGQSEKPYQSYSVPGFAKDTLDLLDALKIDSCHMVGLSLGGMIAFQLAVDEPDRFTSITIANSLPESPQSLVVKWWVMSRIWEIKLFGLEFFAKRLSKRLFPYPDQYNLRQLLLKHWNYNDKETYLSSLEGILGWSVRDKIGGIYTPTLVVGTDHDYSPLSYKQAYVDEMPNATLKIIEDCHHAVTAEKPKEFNSILHHFLKSL